MDCNTNNILELFWSHSIHQSMHKLHKRITLQMFVFFLQYCPLFYKCWCSLFFCYSLFFFSSFFRFYYMIIHAIVLHYMIYWTVIHIIQSVSWNNHSLMFLLFFHYQLEWMIILFIKIFLLLLKKVQIDEV